MEWTDEKKGGGEAEIISRAHAFLKFAVMSSKK